MIYLASLCRTAVHLAHTNLLLLVCGRESECSCWLSKSICTVVHLQTTDSTCMCAVSPPSLFPSLPPSLLLSLSLSSISAHSSQTQTVTVYASRGSARRSSVSTFFRLQPRILGSLTAPEQKSEPALAKASPGVRKVSRLSRRSG